MMMQAVEIQKNGAETIRIERTTYHDYDVIDVRVWWGIPGGNNARPTRKGLTLQLDTWREVLPVIHELIYTEDPERKDGES